MHAAFAKLHTLFTSHHTGMAKLHKDAMAGCDEDTPEYNFHAAAVEHHLSHAEEHVKCAAEHIQCAKEHAMVSADPTEEPETDVEKIFNKIVALQEPETDLYGAVFPARRTA